LIEIAARYADRISINLELPTQKSLDVLAPEKSIVRTRHAMGRIRNKLDEAHDRRKNGDKKVRHATGQSTQVIVGADDSTDADFLARSDDLYGNFKMRRVYYSAFSPIPEPSSLLPIKAPPLVREHRLYQADWLMRFYGFKTSEILSPETPNLDLELDPKLAWALRNRQDFPVDIQTASRETLLRVPGLGVRNVERILQIRRFARIRLADLARLRVSLTKVRPFLKTEDHHPASYLLDSDSLRARFLPKPSQLELFPSDEIR
jgi:predicted DNA-binding helix-hairpin-helix protein